MWPQKLRKRHHTQPLISSNLFSKSDNFIETMFLGAFPVQGCRNDPNVQWHSEMPVARGTTTANKAIENFTINYFKRINTSQVFNDFMEPFRNLWELTLHCTAFCWKRHKYSRQIKYLLHVSVQKLALSNFSKIQRMEISHGWQLRWRFQTKHKWLTLQH